MYFAIMVLNVCLQHHFLSRNIYNDALCINGSKITTLNVFHHLNVGNTLKTHCKPYLVLPKTFTNSTRNYLGSPVSLITDSLIISYTAIYEFVLSSNYAAN